MGFTHLQTTKQRLVLPRKGRRRLKGYRTFVDTSGLIHIVPVKKRGLQFSFIPFLSIIAIGLVFKAIAMVNLGLTTYQERLLEWQSGTALEQFAALVFAADPASLWLYDSLRGLLI